MTLHYIIKTEREGGRERGRKRERERERGEREKEREFLTMVSSISSMML